MKITNSILDGDWEDINIWDNGVPDDFDVVFINNKVVVNSITKKIQNLYIVGEIILKESSILNINSILIGGEGIYCEEGSFIKCLGRIKNEIY